MSVYFIGDPHLGHKNIGKFRPFVKDSENNTAMIVKDWTQRINKRGIVYVMGDAAFDQQSLDVLGNLPGKKILIKGNHDDFCSTAAQSSIFDEIHGIIKYKGMWLSHAPVHPHELRGRFNVHGHVHCKSIQRKTWYGRSVDDLRYINVCPDIVWPKYKKFILSLEEIKQICKQRKQ